jgi:hypothetical protein
MEVVVTELNVLSRNLHGPTDKTTKNLNQDSQGPGRDTNRTPPEYKLEPLSLEPTWSVFIPSLSHILRYAHMNIGYYLQFT